VANRVLREVDDLFRQESHTYFDVRNGVARVGEIMVGGGVVYTVKHDRQRSCDEMLNMPRPLRTYGRPISFTPSWIENEGGDSGKQLNATKCLFIMLWGYQLAIIQHNHRYFKKMP
jgi:hypothetical protein